MKDIHMSREAKIDMNLIQDKAMNLYETAYGDGRQEVLDEISLAIQEKDASGDLVAMNVLLWLRDKVCGIN